jgi:hypothetical protein
VARPQFHEAPIKRCGGVTSTSNESDGEGFARTGDSLLLDQLERHQGLSERFEGIG